MKANPWITCRTRFLVKAKQLTTSLNFTDVLGRQHSGGKGDYLVESNDGILRIAPRQIFEDIYVPLLVNETPANEIPINEAPWQPETSEQPSTLPQYETLLDETSQSGANLPQPGTLRKRQTAATLSLPPHLTRKSPQPYRDRRTPVPGLRSL
jgi:hypothetical protein